MKRAIKETTEHCKEIATYETQSKQAPDDGAFKWNLLRVGGLKEIVSALEPAKSWTLESTALANFDWRASVVHMIVVYCSICVSYRKIKFCRKEKRQKLALYRIFMMRKWYAREAASSHEIKAYFLPSLHSRHFIYFFTILFSTNQHILLLNVFC